MYASSSDTFYKYYRQRGGALGSVDGIPVFKGARRHGQGGAGLGDMLRSAFRWFLPVAMRGASTFANQFLKSHDQGATFRDAAKSAIGPTLGVAGDAIRSRMQAREKQQQAAAADAPQTGTGRKRRRRVYKGAAKRRKTVKKRKQVGQGRRRTKKTKKQRGGRKRKATKQRGGKKRKATKRRRRRRASTTSIASYNF